MSNYQRLGYCKRCNQMTNHWYMDDTPSKGLFTVECGKCSHKPIQAMECENSAIWTDVAIDDNKMKEVAE
jgi:hypothetical protein